MFTQPLVRSTSTQNNSREKKQINLEEDDQQTEDVCQKELPDNRKIGFQKQDNYQNLSPYNLVQKVAIQLFLLMDSREFVLALQPASSVC